MNTEHQALPSTSVEHDSSEETTARRVHILHLGAGNGEELEHYIQQKPSKVFLYEAEVNLYETLLTRCEKIPFVSVLNDVIDVQSEPTTFYCNSPSQFSGLHTEWINAKFPNIRQLDSKLATPITLKKIHQRHSELREPNAENHLILELNGIECDVINQADAATLRCFEHIRLSVCKQRNDDAYQQSKTFALAGLMLLGYQLQSRHTHGLFEQYYFHFPTDNDEQTADAYTQDEQAKNANHRVTPLLSSLAHYFTVKPQQELEAYQNSALDEFAKLAAQLTEQESRCEQLVTQNDQLQAQKAALDGEKQTLSEQLAQANQATQQLKEQAAKQSEQITTSEQANAQATERIQQLEQTLQEATAKHAELNNTIEQLKNQKAALDGEKQTLSEQLAQANQATQQLKEQAAKQSEQITTSEQANAQATERIQQLEQKLQEATAKHAELNNTIEQLKNQKATLDGEKQTLSEQLAQANQATQQLKEQAAKQSEQITTSEQANAQATERIQQLEQTLQEATAKHAELNNTIEQLKNQKAALDGEKQTLSEQLAQANQATQQLKEQAAKQTEQIAAGEQTNAQATERIQHLEQTLQEATAKHAELNNTIELLRAEKMQAEGNLTKLQSALSDIGKENKELTSHMQKIISERDEITKQRDEENKWRQIHKDREAKLAQQVDSLKKELDELNKQKDSIIKEHQIKSELLEEQLSKANQQLREAISAFSINEKNLDAVISKIVESHKSELAELKRKFDWRLDKGLTNTVKQIESFIGVTSFLETGNMAMEYHGWPISSDIALFLLGKIKTEDYDLIIEFGSGTSTKMFAQAISLNQEKTQGILKLPNAQRTNLVNSESVGFSIDLPKRVLTFEHNQKYYNKTLESLQIDGLEHLVNLVHAPLVDNVIDEKKYLYYDCDRTLQHIAEIYEGRTAKILVLIDGPPGSTGPLARLPAINKLLNHLGNHRLDLILDDYNRNEEKEIAESWKKTLESRFINYVEELIPCEKGAWFCKVNT